MDLIDPELRFDRMAEAMGVPSKRVERPEDLARGAQRSDRAPGRPVPGRRRAREPGTAPLAGPSCLARRDGRWRAELAARCARCAMRPRWTPWARRDRGRGRTAGIRGISGQRRRRWCRPANLYQDFLAAYAPERRRALGVYYTPDAGRAAPRCGWRPTCSNGVLAAAEHMPTSACWSWIRRPAAAPIRWPWWPSSRRCGRSRVEPGAAAAAVRADGRRGAALPARAWRRAPAADALSVEQLRRARRADRLRRRRSSCASATRPTAASAAARLAAPAAAAGCASARPHARPILKTSSRRARGLHAKNLYNDYVYFWRWALWAVFEQRSGPGMVSFVTAVVVPARARLSPACAACCGACFDELWIVDLEGDHLAARRTDNVFPIRTPVAIAMGVRYAACAPARPGHGALRPPRRAAGRQTGTRSERFSTLDDLAWQTAPPGWPTSARSRGQHGVRAAGRS